MPRNKSAKRTTNSKKSQTMSSLLVTVQKMEQELLQAPAKIAAHLQKEIAAHKQQESKLQKALAKATSSLKSTEARVKSAFKTKHTASGKKLVKAAKKAHSEAVTTCKDLSRQLQALSKAMTTLFTKQAKLTAFGKYLSQFEKEWKKAAKTKSSMVKAKQKTKTKKKTKQAKPTNKKDSAVVHDLHRHTDDATFEETNFDEPTELVA